MRGALDGRVSLHMLYGHVYVQRHPVFEFRTFHERQEADVRGCPKRLVADWDGRFVFRVVFETV